MGDMSTEIADLPGPIPEDMEEPEEWTKGYNDQQSEQEFSYDTNYPVSNISSHIQKKYTQENFTQNQNNFEFTQNFTKELTKENLLILIIVYIATLPQADEYTRKFLVMLPFNLVRSPIMTTIIKCLLLVSIFIIIKNIF